MKMGKFIVLGLVSLVATQTGMAKMVDNSAGVYKNRCANCHGVTANGVPKLKEQSGTSAEQAAASGMSSQERDNIYGPPLNVYTKEELVQKLADLRNKDFDSGSFHSVMRKNLKHIEEREGKLSDEKMAEYIAKTFGHK